MSIYRVILLRWIMNYKLKMFCLVQDTAIGDSLLQNQTSVIQTSSQCDVCSPPVAPFTNMV